MTFRNWNMKIFWRACHMLPVMRKSSSSLGEPSNSNDNNLSHKLVDRLKPMDVEAVHVKSFGLQEASDNEIWQYATPNNYHILTKDSDFSYIVALRGFSPKVIQLDIGNKSTKAIVDLLEQYSETVAKFLTDNETGLLVLMNGTH